MYMYLQNVKGWLLTPSILKWFKLYVFSFAVEAEVEFDYDAVNTDELSLRKGNVIKNIDRMEGGWWEGELDGRRGMFPDNFVKVRSWPLSGYLLHWKIIKYRKPGWLWTDFHYFHKYLHNDELNAMFHMGISKNCVRATHYKHSTLAKCYNVHVCMYMYISKYLLL